MKINWQLVARWVIGILLTIIGYIGMQMVLQLADIEKELTSIKVELVKVQSSMLNEATVRMIVRDEIHNMGGK